MKHMVLPYPDLTPLQAEVDCSYTQFQEQILRNIAGSFGIPEHMLLGPTYSTTSKVLARKTSGPSENTDTLDEPFNDQTNPTEHDDMPTRNGLTNILRAILGWFKGNPQGGVIENWSTSKTVIADVESAQKAYENSPEYLEKKARDEEERLEENARVIDIHDRFSKQLPIGKTFSFGGTLFTVSLIRIPHAIFSMCGFHHSLATTRPLTVSVDVAYTKKDGDFCERTFYENDLEAILAANPTKSRSKPKSITPKVLPDSGKAGSTLAPVAAVEEQL